MMLQAYVIVLMLQLKVDLGKYATVKRYASSLCRPNIIYEFICNNLSEKKY